MNAQTLQSRRSAVDDEKLEEQIPWLSMWKKLFVLIIQWMYEGESNENRKKIFKFNLLIESGTQLYHFST
jgi:hypothetical protein